MHRTDSARRNRRSAWLKGAALALTTVLAYVSGKALATEGAMLDVASIALVVAIPVLGVWAVVALVRGSSLRSDWYGIGDRLRQVRYGVPLAIVGAAAVLGAAHTRDTSTSRTTARMARSAKLSYRAALTT